MPCKRAKSETFTSGCKLSATIAAFSAAVHRRRRSARDQFDPAILAAFVPVLMHGTITGTSHSYHPTARLKLAACRSACSRRQVTASHRIHKNGVPARDRRTHLVCYEGDLNHSADKLVGVRNRVRRRETEGRFCGHALRAVAETSSAAIAFDDRNVQRSHKETVRRAGDQGTAAPVNE